jgi:hypothetical protein
MEDVMKLGLHICLGLVVAGLAGTAEARVCDGRQVVTNTVAGSAMTGNIATRNPQYAQMAALVARVDPVQQDWARAVALQTLRSRGYGDQNMFDLLFMQAKSGQQTQRAMNGLGGAVLGGVVGGIFGGIAGDVTKGAMGGGTAGAIYGLAAGQAVSIVVDASLVQPAFLWLIDNPCEITAGEALARIAR